MQFIKAPWTGKNAINDMVDWSTVIHHLDPGTGFIVKSPQKIDAIGTHASAFSEGARICRTTAFDVKDLPRGVVPLTFADLTEIFRVSATEKITIAEACFKVKGEGGFTQDVILAHRGEDAPQVYAWYPGCENPQPSQVAPVRKVGRPPKVAAEV